MRVRVRVCVWYSKGYCNRGFVIFFQTEVSVNDQAAANDMECQDLSVKVSLCGSYSDVAKQAFYFLSRISEKNAPVM